MIKIKNVKNYMRKEKEKKQNQNKKKNKKI